MKETSGAFLDALVACSPDAIIVVDGQGRIEMANASVETLFGYPVEEILGKPVELLVPERLREDHRARRIAYTTDPISRPMGLGLDLYGRRRDGSVFPVDVSLSPLAFESRVRTAAFVRDATGRRRGERLMRDVNEVTQAVLAGAYITDVLMDVSERARLLVDASVAWVVVPDESNPDRLWVRAATGRGADRLLGASLDATTSLSIRSMQAGQPLVLADMGSEPAVMLEARRGGYGPGAYLPMVSEHGPIGALVVARDSGREPFDESEVTTAEVFASAAAVGIALGTARDSLEEFHLLSEHERIGRDLHDTVIQRLFGLGMRLQADQRSADPPLDQRIREAVEAIDEVIREIRETIFDLNRPPGADLDVRQRIRGEAEDVGTHLGLSPRVTFRGPVEAALSDETMPHLVAVLREALTNVGKHAQASKVDVVLQASAASVTLSVADDGKGVPDGPSAGNGLANMADRAAELGGELQITARKPRGTLVQWTVPTKAVRP